MEIKKKVLILGKLPPPYMGPSVAFKILIDSRLKDYYELYHLDVKANTSLETLGKWSFKKLRINFDIYKRLLSILRKNKPDLVLIPISQATLGFVKDSVFIILCRITGRKCLVQLRGSDFLRWVSNAGFITRIYVKNVLRITSGVLVLGQKLKYLFRDYFDDSRIFVVPNGADYAVNPVQRNDKGPVKIIYLANLQPSKGIEDVISAIRILERSHSGEFSLQVIGGWRKESTKVNCLKMVKENKLPVSFLSPEVSKNKFDYLMSSDIFVFTPREPEGHPWVIIEAMASGLPVITTDQGAITESVIDGDNGFIVPVNNPHEIASKLSLLIKDPGLRLKMGAQSRRYYLDKFTGEKMISNYIRVFDQVIRS